MPSNPYSYCHFSSIPNLKKINLKIQIRLFQVNIPTLLLLVTLLRLSMKGSSSGSMMLRPPMIIPPAAASTSPMICKQ